LDYGFAKTQNQGMPESRARHPQISFQVSTEKAKWVCLK